MFDALNHCASNCKALVCFKDELDSVPCYAFMCRCKVDTNVLNHVDLVEKKTAKGVKRKMKDDHLRFGHYLDVLRSFES